MRSFIDDGEIACIAGLQVQHAGQQHASVADEKTPRLEQQPVFARAPRPLHGERVLVGVYRLFAAVADAEAATQVDVR